MLELNIISSTDMEKRVVRLQFTGKLNYETSLTAREQLHGIIEKLENDVNCVLDVSGLSRIDSTGFGVLIYFVRQAALRNSRSAVVVADPFIADLFHIAKFNQIMPITGSEAEALKSLESGQAFPLAPEQY